MFVLLSGSMCSASKVTSTLNLVEVERALTCRGESSSWLEARRITNPHYTLPTNNTTPPTSENIHSSEALSFAAKRKFPHPKSDMFKKKQGKKPNIRRRNNEDDGDDNPEKNNGSENDPSSTHLQIQQKKKRRMVLESLQYRKGVSATRLLQKSPMEKLLDQQVDEKISDDPNQREGVLEQKHRIAMEEYIEENLGTFGTNKEDVADFRSDGSALNATEKLYAQLSEAAMRLAGRSAESHPIDADVGAGGGLVAGTGLAEVVLPMEERLATLEATARAAKARKQPSSDTDLMKRLPSSKPNANPVPSRFSAPSRPKVLNDSATGQEGVVEGTKNNEDVPDNDRVGFEAFRRQQAGETGSRHPNISHERGHRATDDRAYKNFVTKQRERRQNR